MRKIISLLALGLTAATASSQFDYQDWTNNIAPAGWPSSWEVDTDGYIHDGTNGPMWPVQIADLPDDPSGVSMPASVSVDTPLANHKWFYRWRWSPVRYRTHTPFRRLNYEMVNVVTDPDINYDGAMEGPTAVYDGGDLTAFTSLFQAQDPSTDLVAPYGVWDEADLSEFISRFNVAGVKVEERIGWVQSGMWVGIDPAEVSDIPVAQPYYENVDSFQKVNNMWQSWRVQTTEGSNTEQHAEEVVIYNADTSVGTMSSLAHGSSGVRLLKKPDPIKFDHDNDDNLETPDLDQGSWQLLWYDKAALEARNPPIQVPIALQSTAVSKDAIDFDIDNMDGATPPQVIWVNVRHEKTATSWETYRYVPAGINLAWNNNYKTIKQVPVEDVVEEDTYYDGTSKYITDFYDGAPSQLWTPQMFGILDGRDADTRVAYNQDIIRNDFYSNRLGMPESLRPSTSPISAYHTGPSDDPDYSKFDGSAHRPWTVEPVKVDSSTTVIRPYHADLQSGYSPEHIFHIPRYVDLARNPLDHAELELGVAGYDNVGDVYTDYTASRWDFRLCFVNSSFTIGYPGYYFDPTDMAVHSPYIETHTGSSFDINPPFGGVTQFNDLSGIDELENQIKNEVYTETMTHFSDRDVSFITNKFPSTYILENGPEEIRDWQYIDDKLTGFYASTILLEHEARNGEETFANDEIHFVVMVADTSAGYVPLTNGVEDFTFVNSLDEYVENPIEDSYSIVRIIGYHSVSLLAMSDEVNGVADGDTKSIIDVYIPFLEYNNPYNVTGPDSFITYTLDGRDELVKVNGSSFVFPFAYLKEFDTDNILNPPGPTDFDLEPESIIPINIPMDDPFRSIVIETAEQQSVRIEYPNQLGISSQDPNGVTTLELYAADGFAVLGEWSTRSVTTDTAITLDNKLGLRLNKLRENFDNVGLFDQFYTYPSLFDTNPESFYRQPYAGVPGIYKKKNEQSGPNNDNDCGNCGLHINSHWYIGHNNYPPLPETEENDRIFIVPYPYVDPFDSRRTVLVTQIDPNCGYPESPHPGYYLLNATFRRTCECAEEWETRGVLDKSYICPRVLIEPPVVN